MDTLPQFSGMIRDEAFSPANELSRVADKIEWSRPPEMSDFERTAELEATVAYYSSGGLVDTEAAERKARFQLLQFSNLAWGRIVRKISGPRGSPYGARPKKPDAFQEVEIIATFEYTDIWKYTFRPRREAVNYFSAAVRGARTAELRYTPFLFPHPHAAPRVPLDPHRERAAGAGKGRQWGNEVRTPFLDAGQLALHYRDTSYQAVSPRFGISFGGMGSMLTNLAHLLGLGIHKSMEKASGYEKSKIQLGPT